MNPLLRSALQRVFPAPRLAVLLLLAWCLLNRSFAPGHLVLGALLGIALPWIGVGLRMPRPHFHRAEVLLRLAANVAFDIVTSNLELARRVLGPERELAPAFVWVPLRINDPHGIVALAGIITLTPGTLSSELSPDHRHLLVHVFHLVDEAALIESIRRRYEQPLIEILES